MKQNDRRCTLQHQIWQKGSVILSATDAAALVRILKSSKSFSELMSRFQKLRKS